MPVGPEPTLVLGCLVVLAAGFLLVRRILGAPLALAVASVRAAVPLAYFAWLQNGTWRFSDDLEHLSRAGALARHGWGPLSVLRDGLPELVVVSGGGHILYSWYNLLAFSIFGPHYYAPVLLNVLATFVAARYLVELMPESEYSDRYRAGAAAFFLLHWDVVVWSSLVNLKDTLVLTGTVIALCGVLRLWRRPTFLTAAWVAGLLALMSFLRFYVPLLILLASVAWVLVGGGLRRSRPVVLAAGVVLVLFLPWAELGQYATLGAAPKGMLRFLLSPQPWSVDPQYSFLIVPSVLHWLLFGPAIAAAVLLWRSRPSARLPLLYLASAAALYSLIPLAQGPRHRVQTVFVLAWLQYHALWVLARVAALRADRTTPVLQGQVL